MARQPRFGLVGYPQHVIQRGNNRQACFFVECDYTFYLEKLADACAKHGCDVHAYVLMTNHLHLLITPTQEHSLSNKAWALGSTQFKQRIKPQLARPVQPRPGRRSEIQGVPARKHSNQSSLTPLIHTRDQAARVLTGPFLNRRARGLFE